MDARVHNGAFRLEELEDIDFSSNLLPVQIACRLPTDALLFFRVFTASA